MAAAQEAILPLIPNLRAFARSLTVGNRELADDLVQDTIVLALQGWDQFTPDTNLRAWLFRILRNHFINLIRRRQRTLEIADEAQMQKAWVPAAQDGRLEVMAFRQAFQALSPMHREVLSLVVLQNLPYEQVAEICGCEVGTVKSRVSRARTLLKDMLLGETPLPAPTASARPVEKPKKRPRKPAVDLPKPVPARPVPPAPPRPVVPVVRTPIDGERAALWLAETEQKIAQVQRQVAEHRLVVKHVARAGGNAGYAEALLQLAERRLRNLHAHRQWLLERVRPGAEAAEAGVTGG